MRFITRVGIWVAIAVAGIVCCTIPTYHALREYRLSYTGPDCAANQKHDCLIVTNAVVTDKHETTTSTGQGTSTTYEVFTDHGSYEVYDLYSHVHKGDQVQIRRLNGHVASISKGKAVDDYDSSMKDDATLWGIVTGVLLMLLAAATYSLFDEEAIVAVGALVVLTPVTAAAGLVGLAIFMAIFGGITGIVISWIVAAAIGAAGGKLAAS